MTTYPSAPISGATLTAVKSVAHDWDTDEDWRRFRHAVSMVEIRDGEVSADAVRERLRGVDGELTINPRRLSAFYARAVAQGLLEYSHWGINGDHKGHNAGRPARVYRLAAAA
ncbi:MAG: hypothetical protein JWM76_4206 [Pseudonocardiales bacterium]|nr:hypothetical protein [Pseudonocardiales bacterium]